MNDGRWTVVVGEDEDGNSILPFPEEMLASLDWRDGDDLDFTMNGDGTCTIVNISWQDRNKDTING